MNILDGKNGAKAPPLAERVPAPLFFTGSAVFHYLGPSFAVLLFARIPVAGVAWLRIVSAAAVFAAWRRPWHVFFATTRDGRRAVVVLGAVFALMNYSFYIAIDRLPLGTVAAIEFIGPIVLALAGSRSLRNFCALVLATGGVGLLMDVRLSGDTWGFAWAFANAALFALYIVLAHKLARIDPATGPIDRLGASMLVAAGVIMPLGGVQAMPALASPWLLAAGAGVGISSSVIPYMFDQLAMRRLPRATYALFVSLLPVMAVIIGLVVLQQVPTLVEALGVVLVTLGIAIHRQAG